MESIVDIVKLAIANEVKAKVYYERASEVASGGESQMVFLELVEMEATHARRLIDAFGTQLDQAGLDPEDFLAQLTASAEHSLGAAETRLLQDADMRQVVDFAIGMEIQARDTYLELARRVEGERLRRLCKDLADEEQQHHDLLSEARSGIDMPPDERPAL